MGTEHWVRRAQDGDKDAFLRLMRESEDDLYRTAKAILRREEDVEDAVQETVCRAFSRLSELRRPGAFRSWLIRILVNCCCDLLRQQKGLVSLEVVPETEGKRRDEELSMDVRAALAALSRNDRLLMTLYYLDDLPVREIAEMTGLTESAVKQRLCRARKRFRQTYEEREGEEAVYEN